MMSAAHSNVPFLRKAFAYVPALLKCHVGKSAEPFHEISLMIDTGAGPELTIVFPNSYERKIPRYIREVRGPAIPGRSFCGLDFRIYMWLVKKEHSGELILQTNGGEYTIDLTETPFFFRPLPQQVNPPAEGAEADGNFASRGCFRLLWRLICGESQQVALHQQVLGFEERVLLCAGLLKNDKALLKIDYMTEKVSLVFGRKP